MATLDLTPDTADFIIYRGDTQPITFSYIQRSTGDLQSLTGATAKMDVKNEIESDTVIYEFPLTIDEENNTIQALIDDWSLVTWTTGIYDLEVTYQGGIIETWCKGTITIEGDISQ
jgi:hypothetical protein